MSSVIGTRAHELLEEYLRKRTEEQIEQGKRLAYIEPEPNIVLGDD